MADPLGTIQSLVDAAKHVRELYKYVRAAIEAGETMTEMFEQTSDVVPQLRWISEHLPQAFEPDSPQRELLTLFVRKPSQVTGVSGGGEELEEGPILRQLRALFEDLQHKLRPLDDKEKKKLSAEEKKKLVVRQNKSDWDGKAITAESQFTDGKIRHKTFRSHLHDIKDRFQRMGESNLYRQAMFPLSEEELVKDLQTLQSLCDTIQRVVNRAGVDVGARGLEVGTKGLEVSTKSLEVGNMNLDVGQKARTEAAEFHGQWYKRTEFKDFGKIVNWLTPLSFREAYHDTLDPLIGPAIDSDWLIADDSVKDWRVGRPWRLFILGNAGSGKTILSSQIIAHLEEKYCGDSGTAVLYLFLKYQEQNTQTLRSLLASLLRQIVEKYGQHGVPEGVKELWAQQSVSASRPPTTHILKLLTDEIGKLDRTFIIIDGLDEASDDTRRDLEHYTLQLADRFNSSHVNGKVSMIYTSRPLDQDVRTTAKHCDGLIDGEPCENGHLNIFFKCRNTKEHGDHFHLCRRCAVSGVNCNHPPHELSKMPKDRLDVMLQPPEESMRKFVTALIDKELQYGAAKRASVATNDSRIIDGQVYGNADETTSLARMLRRDPELREKITEAIVENARGLYLLAAFQWKHVHDCYSGTKVDEALNNLPQELNNSFADTLKRMVGRDVPEYRKLPAKRVVLWVSHARRLLTLQDLTAALSKKATEEDDEGDERDLDQSAILAWTRGLVVVGADLCVRLFHRTAYEYLNNLSREENNMWFPDAQDHMALVCLRTLLDSRLQAAAKGTDEDGQIKQRLKEIPFVSYAAQHWGFHAQTCQNNAKIAQLARKLLADDGYLASAVQISAYCEQDQPTGWDQPQGVNALHVAAWFGLESVFAELADKGLDVDGSENNTMGRTPLIYACRGGRPEAVHKLVALGVDINKRDANMQRGYPPLFHAALRENAASMQALCAYNHLDINMRIPANRTVLMETAKRGYVPELKALLKRKDLDVNLQDDPGKGRAGGFTALMLASHGDSIPTIQALLSMKSIDIEKTDSCRKHTALHLAAITGNDQIVHVLLKHKSNPDARDIRGGTPLRRAIDNGQQAVIQEFKEQGHLPITGTEDDEGKNLLFSAAVNGHSAVVGDLIAAGFDVNSRAKNSRTPLHDAAGSVMPANMKLETVKTLIGAGADKALKDTEGKTAADLAYEAGDIDIGDLINPTPESGAGPHEEKDLPATSLARRGRIDALKTKTDYELLELSGEGETPLAIAISNRHYDGAELILGAYARQAQSIDVPSKYNRTPLHEAAKSTQAWLVKKLLAHAPAPAVDRMDNLGKTPLSEAISNGDTEAVIALLEKGAEFDQFHRATDEMLKAGIQGGNVVVVKAMVRAGAVVGPSHRSLARENGDAEMIGLLNGHNV